jgi:MEDS: MEthanogen/methylotroph, DcmR Sensory domain
VAVLALRVGETSVLERLYDTIRTSARLIRIAYNSNHGLSRGDGRILNVMILPDPSLSPIDYEAHTVQFYTEDDFLLKGLCEFVRAGLSGGQSVVLIMTRAHREALAQCLESAGVEVNEAAKTGRYISADASKTLATFMDNDVPARKKFFSQIGSFIARAKRAAPAKDKPVAVFGEMVTVLWEQKRFTAAIELEKLWNELAKTHNFYLRCAYPARLFDDMKVPYATICAEHSEVFPAA